MTEIEPYSLLDSYGQVCRDLSLDSAESRDLWLAIVHEIERVARKLSDPEAATEQEILGLCDALRIPTFASLGARVRREHRRVKEWQSAPLGFMWSDFMKPKRLIAETSRENYGRFTAQPFERG